jgi:hypothetical protein
LNRRAVKILALIVYGIFFVWFYYRYVPLIPAYQAVLAPILVFLLVRTATDARKGLLAFSFIFPLINVLPYFFGIDERIPHAPAALVAFLVFVMGRMTGRIFADPPSSKAPIGLPLKLLAAWGGMSALITFLRYMDFFPWAAPGIHELKVNVAGLSAGGARMSVIFTSASLLSGIAMFAFFRQASADKGFMRRLVIVFSLSATLSFLFGYFQSLWPVAPGNTPYWNELGQINATFKDPNSLAAFIAGFVPLLIAFALGQSGARHVFLIVVVGLGLGLLPLSGSRSGMAAVAVAAVVFLAGIFRHAGKALRKRAAYYVAGFILLFVAWNVVVVYDSALSRRIGWSISQIKDQIKEKTSPDDSQIKKTTDPGDFFNHRLTLWAAAGRMFRDAPLTGIGLGAFIVTFPDYLKNRNLPLNLTDTALNLAFQIGAEAGLVGLILSLAFFGGLVGRMGRVFRESVPGGSQDCIGIGAVSGLAAFLFNFLFHTYAASFEIQFLFWFLAAIVFMERSAPPSGKPQKAASWVVPAAVGGLLIAGAVYLAVSIGPYSISARAEKYGWTQAFGFYDAETDPQIGGFQWTGKTAGFSLIQPSPRLVLTLRASNPDLGLRPLPVRVYRANRHFRKSELAGTIVLKDASWTRFPIELPDVGDGTVYLVIEPERTWNPRRSLRSATDDRDLGVSVKSSGLGALFPDRP